MEMTGKKSEKLNHERWDEGEEVLGPDSSLYSLGAQCSVERNVRGHAIGSTNLGEKRVKGGLVVLSDHKECGVGLLCAAMLSGSS